jgi:hypothetical protein
MPRPVDAPRIDSRIVMLAIFGIAAVLVVVEARNLSSLTPRHADAAPMVAPFSVPPVTTEVLPAVALAQAQPCPTPLPPPTRINTADASAMRVECGASHYEAHNLRELADIWRVHGNTCIVEYGWSTETQLAWRARHP